MKEVNLEISSEGVLILFDDEEAKKLIEKLKENGLDFKTKRIYCG